MEQKYYKIKTIQYDDNMTFFYFNICPNGDKQTAVFVSNENYPIIKRTMPNIKTQKVQLRQSP